MQAKMGRIVQCSIARAAMAQANLKAVKDIYDIGEIPPQFHFPKQMWAWAIRKERHGRPLQAMQLEQVPTPQVGEDEALVLVMAAGVNYNGVWAALGEPLSVLDVHKQPYHVDWNQFARAAIALCEEYGVAYYLKNDLREKLRE